jgi:hypothetical protein
MDGIEIVGEILGGTLEAAATGGSNDRKGCGCLIAIVVMIILGFVIYFVYFAETSKVVPHKTCGKIIYKLDNDSILLDVNGKKKIYRVSHDLFINKKENDSLCIVK